MLLPLTIIAEASASPTTTCRSSSSGPTTSWPLIGNHAMTATSCGRSLLSQHEFFDYFGRRIDERRAEPRTTT